MTGEKKKKSSASRESVMEELVAELRHFRGAVREVGESFILRREGEIEAVISSLETVPTALLKRESAGWLHEIRGVKLKPAKGRLKDLKVIDELIEALTDQVIAAQDGKKGAGKR
ncbi:MAG TPA: hypothetical protein VF775_00050 [Geobacteraceae bacterium]